VGICNIGNSCYLNSIIQALYANEHLKTVILTVPNPDPLTQPTIYLLQQIFQSLERKDTACINISHLVQNPGNGDIYNGLQQDASETLQIILNTAFFEINNPAHPINFIFNIELETTIHCPHCGQETKKNETALTLPLPLSPRLSTSLTNFLAPPAISDYYCEFCWNYGVLSRINLTPSQTLILTLNRFEYKSGKMIKRNDKMEFPEELNICGHTYKLKCIIMHHGGYYSGHYYAFIKPLNSTTWFLCNDSSVRNVGSFNDIKQSCFGDGKSSLNAYILFFDLVL
jgi:uncharacterized UBP type Zn finger protein